MRLYPGDQMNTERKKETNKETNTHIHKEGTVGISSRNSTVFRSPEVRALLLTRLQLPGTNYLYLCLSYYLALSVLSNHP